MKSTGRASLLELNLPQLQNLIRRDPSSYREEFLRQWRHFESNLEIIKLNPAHELKDFADLILFIAHVAYCYPKEVQEFGPKIMELLRAHHSVLEPELRRALVQALTLLRTKNLLEQTDMLSLFFYLFRCRDKTLRATLYKYIVTDIKNANLKSKNNKLNRSLQNYMFTMISGENHEGTAGLIGSAEDMAAKFSLDICIELYRKQIWNDAKTVSIIAEACFSPSNKVMVTALQFFLEVNRDQEDDDSDEDIPDMNHLQFRAAITKKTKNQKARLERAKKTVKRREKRSHKAERFNASALHLLQDPQGFAEKLFHQSSKQTSTSSVVADEFKFQLDVRNRKMTPRSGGTSGGKITSVREVKFEVRLMILDLISRIIGIHKLILLNFYPGLIRYLKPHQKDIMKVLVICAQASHDLVPPECLETVIRAIMDNFCLDSFAAEVISAGMNAIREICSRCPLAMDSEILNYLITFKSHRDKGVMIATRSLIALFREVNPELLPKRERGKTATMALSAGHTTDLTYGKVQVVDAIPGTEILASLGEPLDEEEERQRWEVVEEDSDSSSSGDWIAVSSDEERDIVLSDSEIGETEDESEDEIEEESVVDEMEWSEEEEEEEDAKDGTDDEKQSIEASERTGRAARVEMTRILTPADFALIKKAKEEAEVDRLTGNVKPKRDRSASPSADNNIVDTSVIHGYRKKKKQTKEERMASIEEGRKDREKFGSRKGKDRTSTTNREKSKKKNFLMMVHKRSVKNKKKMSLRDKQIRLRQHIDKQKKYK